ncbi:hypothetical protein [Streptacidiphilus anmyonensis]|uniref:hypothetical protein n=1 Tax=Streptacidiphilus anmyonensis TaxID=405782 RepID=UPI0005A88013|nr:hypothetical protein [Streptacidiphilus anmyonensis]
MTLTIPLVSFLIVVIFLIVRSGELRIWQVLLVGLAGFYLARSPMGNFIAFTTQWLVYGFTHNH